MNAVTMSRKARLAVGVALILGLACGAIPAGNGPTPTTAPQVAATDAVPATPTEPGQAVATTPPQPAGVIAHDPSYSSPIAISEDDALLVVANPLNGSVSVLNVAGDANVKLAEIPTGDQPRSVAIRPDKAYAYVTNQGSGTVSVIDLGTLAKVADIPVGIEPYGLALTPDGGQAYVSNSASNTVSVIDTASNTVIATIAIPGVQPRGIAITNNNGGQGAQFVYVTQFLSQATAGGRPGQDQGSEGKVFVLSTAQGNCILFGAGCQDG